MRLILALIAIAPLLSFASGVRLAWDASPSASVTNYVIYATTNVLNATNFHTAIVRVNIGTNLTATVESMQPGRWSFGVTAMGPYSIESVLSDVVTVEVPLPPTNMRTVVVQYSGTLTNFYDVGFFRLRLP